MNLNEFLFSYKSSFAFFSTFLFCFVLVASRLSNLDNHHRDRDGHHREGFSKANVPAKSAGVQQQQAIKGPPSSGHQPSSGLGKLTRAQFFKAACENNGLIL